LTCDRSVKYEIWLLIRLFWHVICLFWHIICLFWHVILFIMSLCTSLFLISLFIIKTNTNRSIWNHCLLLFKRRMTCQKRHITCQKRPHQMSNFVKNQMSNFCKKICIEQIYHTSICSLFMIIRLVCLLLVSILLVSFASKRTTIHGENESRSESESESDSLLGLFWHLKISLIGLFWHIACLFWWHSTCLFWHFTCLFWDSVSSTNLFWHLMIFYQPL